MICNSRQNWVYHEWCFLVLPISVTLLHDSSHRLLNPVPSRTLEAVADKTVRLTGRTKWEFPKHPWDERRTRRLQGLFSLSWLPGHGLRDLYIRARGTDPALLSEHRDLLVPKWLKTFGLISCSIVWGHQGLREFHLDTTASLMVWNLTCSSYLTLQGVGARKGQEGYAAIRQH